MYPIHRRVHGTPRGFAAVTNDYSQSGAKNQRNFPIFKITPLNLIPAAPHAARPYPDGSGYFNETILDKFGPAPAPPRQFLILTK
ncbi:hypothetical protein [Sporobacter termitidis]|uniref:hypothetical protein n=1 Tax=Sporobacter termitidis TaxID=44749 RepID=UPI0011604B5D|nr:hypothetical protein [Sporobacter termitidis]